ncbi:GH25 family lysozyme [Longitalea arenae]|uniref:GH25 family lysozyme n=1 Tax=Longitalea arenae TaxID=2812558 RepID=UPI001967B68E|nr:GH25 family lysozyme [Longitalea arenae]
MNWLFDIQLLQAVPVVAVVAGLIYLVYRWLQQKQQRRNYTVLKQQLGRDLHRLSELYANALRKASHLLQEYVRTKGSQLQDALLINDQDAVVVDRGAYLKTYHSLLADKEAPRFLTILLDVLYEVQTRWQQLQHIQAGFHGVYGKAYTTYYNNIADLMTLNEELKEYLRGKTLNRQSADWVKGYFSIFDQWLRNGANKDMSVLQQEIVQQLSDLNKRQSGVAFAAKTNDKAHQCIQSFETITALDSEYLNTLQQFQQSNKRAARVMALLSGEKMTEMTPLYKDSPAPAKAVWVFGKKERMAAWAALLLLVVGCFLGGRFTGQRQQAAMAGNNTPATVPKDTVLQQQRSDPVQPKPTGAVLPPDSVAMVSGLDISKYQGNLLKDLPQLDNLHFVICKATQGTTLIDAEFKYNWQRLQELKLVRGAYHFFVANDDPVQQAQHFLQTVGALAKNDIPLIIDIEEGSLTGAVNTNKLQNDLLRCLKYLHQHSGREPVIYTDLSFANTYLRQPALADYPLWLAEYSRRPVPVLPETWKAKGIVFWQKNDTLTIDSRKSDFDVFVGNGSEFAKFLTP